MTPIGSISSAFPSLPITRTETSSPGGINPGSGDSTQIAPNKGFSSMLEGLTSMVDTKEAQAQAMTNQVMMGNSGQLHNSVIAMQEASVALSLMVQVRNKLVESYQELMRMQV